MLDLNSLATRDYLDEIDHSCEPRPDIPDCACAPPKTEYINLTRALASVVDSWRAAALLAQRRMAK